MLSVLATNDYDHISFHSPHSQVNVGGNSISFSNLTAICSDLSEILKIKKLFTLKFINSDEVRIISFHKKFTNSYSFLPVC